MDILDRDRSTDWRQVEKVAQNGGGAGIHHGAEVAVFGADRGGDIAWQVCILATGIGLVSFWFWGFGAGQWQFTRYTRDCSLAQGHTHLCIEGVVIAVAPEDLHIFGAVEAISGIVDEFWEIDTADTTGEITEVLHEISTEAHCFEQQGPAVSFGGGDTHLADNFLEAVFQGGEDILKAFTAGEGPFLFGVRVFE